MTGNNTYHTTCRTLSFIGQGLAYAERTVWRETYDIIRRMGYLVKVQTSQFYFPTAKTWGINFNSACPFSSAQWFFFLLLIILMVIKYFPHSSEHYWVEEEKGVLEIVLQFLQAIEAHLDYHNYHCMTWNPAESSVLLVTFLDNASNTSRVTTSSVTPAKFLQTIPLMHFNNSEKTYACTIKKFWLIKSS